MSKCQTSTNNKKLKRQAVTTITQSRVPIFSPVKQIPKNKTVQVEIQNAWGKVIFKNSRLTQVHRNILDCIFAYCEKRYVHEDGCVTYLISLRQLQKYLGISETNNKWLTHKLDEIRQTTMIVNSQKHGWGIHTGIIRKHKYTKIKNEQLPSNFMDNLYKDKNDHGQPIHDTLYGITFEIEYMQIFREDLNIHSNSLTKEIINLKNPLLQAMVRFCLSHRNLNMKMEDVLTNIGCNLDGKRQKQKLIKKIKDNAVKLEEKFGIKINNDCIFYEQHPSIWFEDPIKSGELPEKQLESAENTGGRIGLIGKGELV